MSNTNIDDSFNAPAAKPAVKTTEMVLAALDWSEDLEVQTRRGPRLVRKAFPTPDFYAIYRDKKDELYRAGYSFAKNARTGEWEVAHWRELPEEKTAAREAAKALSRATDADIDVPVPEGLAYLGYQRAGVAFGCDRPATLIGDEMGLGKTIQAIGIINLDATLKRIAIVCPASLKLNWARELNKWLVRKRTVFVADSSLFPDLEDGIVVVNYDVLHKHAELLRRFEWDLLVCDEAHYLKNAKSRRAKMIFGVAAKKKKNLDATDESLPAIRARRKVFLTGTPIANRPSELFPILNYLDPQRWPNFFAYARRYCNAVQNGFGWDFTGASNLDELQDRLRSTIMIRRLKKDVLTELPPKRRQIIELPATGSALKLIRREADLYEGRADEMDRLQTEVELAKASDNPEEYEGAVKKLRAGIAAVFGELSTIRRELAEAKIQMPEVIEHLADAVESSGKVIVFAHHKQVVAAIKEQFGEAAVMIVGDTEMADRQAAADRFQTDPTCKVIIGSFGAMGVGWTLVAAAHVVFVEEDWVPGNLTQAEDRAHRIGQKESVLIQHIILEGSLDATMVRRTVAKQNVIDAALDKISAARQNAEEAPSRKRSGPAASADDTPDALAAAGAALTEEQIRAATAAVRKLAGVCDGASSRDAHGFNGVDTGIGKSLAARPFLSRKQAALAIKICLKYARQLGPELVDAMKGSAK